MSAPASSGNRLRSRCRVHRFDRVVRADAGFSLLEVISGLVVVGLILIPTTALMKDVLSGEATQRQRSALVHLANSKQAEYGHLLRVSFQDQVQQGDFASAGHPAVRFQVTCDQSTAAGGIPGRLMSIRTFAWYDANNNQIWESPEPSTTLWTSVARATP